MDKHAPIKKVRISLKRRFCEPWMTTRIEEASRKTNKLYKETLKPSASKASLDKYKSYRNIYNKLKQTVKIQYYQTKINKYQKNTRKLLQLINNRINRCKNSGSIIPYITVDGLQTYNPKKIADAFGKFYSQIGAELASKIKPSTIKIDDYISRIPHTNNSLFLTLTSQQEIEETISKLQNKTSFRHDKVSNNLLKLLRRSISYPLKIIFNQSISQGVFPDLMKMAEVVPLYKGKERDITVNYRLISLLMTNQNYWKN